MAGPMPPPGSSVTIGRFLVRKRPADHRRRPWPRRRPRRSPSGTSATQQRSDHPRRSRARSRRAGAAGRPRCRSTVRARRVTARRAAAIVVVMRAPSGRRAVRDTSARATLIDDRDREQHTPSPIERGAVQRVARRFAEVVRDDRGHRVAGLEEVRRDLVARADDERDRDRLADRAPEAEHRPRRRARCAHAGTRTRAASPSASRPSRARRSCRPARRSASTSRLIDVMIGVIMTASTMPGGHEARARSSVRRRSGRRPGTLPIVSAMCL